MEIQLGQWRGLRMDILVVDSADVKTSTVGLLQIETRPIPGNLQKCTLKMTCKIRSYLVAHWTLEP